LPYVSGGVRLSLDAAARFNACVSIRLHAGRRDDPGIDDTGQRFAASVRQVQLEGEWRSASGGVLVSAGVLPRYRSGDVLELEGRLESPPSVDGFDYAEYLARKDIQTVMRRPAAHTVGHEADS